MQYLTKKLPGVKVKTHKRIKAGWQILISYDFIFTFFSLLFCLQFMPLIFLFFRVFFRGVTWMRDSHGLFDYESRNISKKNLKTKYVGKIIRQTNTIEFVSPTTSIEDLPGYKKDEMLTLAQIKQDNSK